jgi:predicted DNA-binding protein (MmcQ/YjbR family)
MGRLACLESRRQGFRDRRLAGRRAELTFKVSDIAYELLKEQPGLRPAPYLASRGLKWIQHYAKPGLSDAALRDYIRQSHAIVAQGLSKKKRIALGFGAV